jgi:hypothetical protein
LPGIKRAKNVTDGELDAAMRIVTLDAPSRERQSMALNVTTKRAEPGNRAGEASPQSVSRVSDLPCESARHLAQLYADSSGSD